MTLNSLYLRMHIRNYRFLVSPEIYFRNVQVPVTTCQPVSVPCPAKEKIHKQWCLFDQISYTPSSLSPSSSNTLTPQTKTKEDQEILGIFESFDLRTVRESNEVLV